MARRFHYGQLMHKALRGLIVEVLADVAENGLPGAHHFFITFDTTHPGIDVPAYLIERHAEDDTMMIVLQEWFDDLSVTSDRFSVVLNFSNTPERLVIPFDAIRTFVDPSVEFGLRFDPTDSAEDDGEAEAPAQAVEPAPERPEGEPPVDGGGDVVSLDRFRKT